ncbi:phosphonate C-P lyase system protein PhnH [Verminephrobacter eiseniae]|uniref:Phosphonate metabolism n=1 Tax=Verminephrobacter eiseniae (strain EF01-2) TaxID=391735 RepID=A1WM36_VEREI|nr:phosphonate C-P lyase system protein PhnH [Verminephrobacter eiseniae]ABM58693.1 phosphonate metabolism [Verminephrobacter eiseniae EF01-2]MCW5284263.1 phosphonate C-P lyase system protein PhnH [Verminephrobacter eiseniae]MCW5301970.1 phosphonate C-P lyase system protein PhnH [Verminephrobacter eiseniae]MCW8178861.1 phosphonate C-P lyase system protein PhnH [Verminephrobacter eiseniae]MCW8190090.1 phosphonate C-P lyase system protein PhnH [Verminephrobacter eiseniae]
MTASILSSLGAGFSNQALGSQAVFRAVLQALAHPGRSVAVLHDAQTPAVGQRASAAVLLALLDSDCRLWLSPRLAASDAGPWLRFHTGCTLVSEPGLAGFAWVAQGDALPALRSLAQGSDSDPDRSATCVVDVALAGAGAVAVPADAGTLTAPAGAGALQAPADAGAWLLTGPGIRGQATLPPCGLAHDFVPQWQANHAAFPCGVDLLLGGAAHIVGLPRTTRIVRTPHDTTEEI